MVDNSSRMAHIWLRIMKTAIVAYKMTANPNVPINEKIDPFKSVEPNFNKKHKCATTALKWPKKVNMVNMMWVVRSNLPADLADGQMHNQISIRLAVINGSIFGFEMHFQNECLVQALDTTMQEIKLNHATGNWSTFYSRFNISSIFSFHYISKVKF